MLDSKAWMEQSVGAQNAVRNRLEALRKGDSSEAEWLYETFGPLLYRRLRLRYSRVGLDAEDLLQDAFIFFFQRQAAILGRYLEKFPAEDQNLLTLERFLWDQACGIASNRLLADKRRRSVPMGEDINWIPEDSGEAASLAKDTLERLDKCLSGVGNVPSIR